MAPYILTWQLYQGAPLNGKKLDTWAEVIKYLDTLYGIYKVTVFDQSMYYKRNYKEG